MPIYEFICRSCGNHFETLVQPSTVVECAACSSEDVEKQLSVFAVGKASGPKPPSQPPGCSGCPGAGSGGCGMN